MKSFSEPHLLSKIKAAQIKDKLGTQSIPASSSPPITPWAPPRHLDGRTLGFLRAWPQSYYNIPSLSFSPILATAYGSAGHPVTK